MLNNYLLCRGSPHLHGVFWFEGAPDVTNLEKESEQKIEEVLQYFSDLVTAINPDTNPEEPGIHPCRTTYNHIKDFEQDLAQLLNKVQRHTKCSVGYCLKNNKCRFKFPKEQQEHSSLKFSEEKKEMEFEPARNDPLMNKYNRFMIQLWRANMDISPVISKKALISYLAKYISKCETSSQALDEILLSITSKLNEDDPSKKAIQRLFIRCCAERDISAQEVCHTLLGLKLYSAGGRSFTILNFSKKEWLPLPEEIMVTTKTKAELQNQTLKNIKTDL